MTEHETRKDPTAFPRRILLMVTGRSPQVVTETLYALAVDRRPPFVPTEVHLITTSEGAEDARRSLLSEDPGWFYRLCRDYRLPPIAFDAGHIHILTDGDGRPMADIRTKADNDWAGDFIVGKVRELAEDPEAALHVSLAGGRKTMGFYLGYALSLYGRPQDCLSHVLVAASFESNREFYYPTQLDAGEAEVTLAEVPFVRMREDLPNSLRRGKASFKETVEAAQQALEPTRLVIDYLRRGVEVHDGTFLEVRPAELAFLGWLARRRQRGDPPVRIPGERRPNPEYLKEYMAEADLADAREGTGIGAKAQKGMTKAFFEQRKARLKERLEEALGPLASA
jgi:CRISPR-associated protein (TIGR02584 family)